MIEAAGKQRNQIIGSKNAVLKSRSRYLLEFGRKAGLWFSG
jgi:hypothetical protein